MFILRDGFKILNYKKVAKWNKFDYIIKIFV